MRHSALASTIPSIPLELPRGEPNFSLDSLSLGKRQKADRRGTSLTVSVVLHVLLLSAIVTLPLFWENVLPASDSAIRAFFVAPQEIAPPPPPPPPPAPGVHSRAATPTEPRMPAKFTAPTDVPAEVRPEPGIDLGIEGGVPGGVEGGVPGGVVGGIVGGLPTEAPPPPARVVRVGGMISAPKLVKRVEPDYPILALQARTQGIVILEAHVDVRGFVKEVTVLRGHPILEGSAIAAVKEWRYQPLLLDGQPTEFILTVTINFRLGTGPREGGA